MAVDHRSAIAKPFARTAMGMPLQGSGLLIPFAPSFERRPRRSKKATLSDGREFKVRMPDRQNLCLHWRTCHASGTCAPQHQRRRNRIKIRRHPAVCATSCYRGVRQRSGLRRVGDYLKTYLPLSTGERETSWLAVGFATGWFRTRSATRSAIRSSLRGR